MFWAFFPTPRCIVFILMNQKSNVMVCENLKIKTTQSVDWLKTEHTASQTEKNRQTDN